MKLYEKKIYIYSQVRKMKPKEAFGPLCDQTTVNFRSKHPHVVAQFSAFQDQIYCLMEEYRKDAKRNLGIWQHLSVWED